MCFKCPLLCHSILENTAQIENERTTKDLGHQRSTHMRTHACVFGNEEIGRALEGQAGNEPLLVNSSVLLTRNTEGKTSWWWHRRMELFIGKSENPYHNVKTGIPFDPAYALLKELLYEQN